MTSGINWYAVASGALVLLVVIGKLVGNVVVDWVRQRNTDHENMEGMRTVVDRLAKHDYTAMNLKVVDLMHKTHTLEINAERNRQETAEKLDSMRERIDEMSSEVKTMLPILIETSTIVKRMGGRREERD